MPFFLFKGEQVYFKEKGKGISIILIHGFLGSHKAWAKIEGELSKNFRVLSIDLPGHGYSRPLGYIHSMELYSECINALVELKRLRKVNVVGHSLGGYVAMAFAEFYPDKIKSLIMINSTAKADSKQRKQERERIIQQVVKKRGLILESLVKSYFTMPHRLRRFWIKSYLNLALKCSNQGIVASIRGMKERKEREIILKFASYPVLILLGIKDPLIAIEQSKEESLLAEKGEFVVLENSGHMSIYEEPYRISRIVKRFIKKIKP